MFCTKNSYFIIDWRPRIIFNRNFENSKLTKIAGVRFFRFSLKSIMNSFTKRTYVYRLVIRQKEERVVKSEGRRGGQKERKW